MKKIIFRKIALDCTSFFLLTVFSIGVIIWVLQAVNFLDVVIEDGHSFAVYSYYTLLNLPKIISKIFPFALFIAFANIFLRYESKNELVVFWNFGIHKKKFFDFFIKFSFLFLIVQLLLTVFLVPKSQDVARSFIKGSDVGLFESLLKSRKFIDAIKNLTIFVDKKEINGDLQNIFLKDNSNDNSFQITFAKNGKFENRAGRKVLVLFDGITINNKNKQLSGFEFIKTDFNISKFDSRTTTTTKTQENTSRELLKCIFILKDVVKTELNQNTSVKFNNCRTGNLQNIVQEMYKRIIMPFYIPIFVLISLFLIIKSKDQDGYNSYKVKIFVFGFLSIIFSEISIKFVNYNIYENILLFSIPIIFFVFLYFLFLIKLKAKK